MLFGAAQHTLARLMALIVGGALAACCVIALIDGEDVLGLAAANWATKLGFGVAAAWLLLCALLPRRARKVDVVADEPVATTAEPATREVVREEPVVVREEPVVDAEQALAVEEQGVRGARPTAVSPVASEPARSDSADADWAASEPAGGQPSSARQAPARPRKPLSSRLRDLTRR